MPGTVTQAVRSSVRASAVSEMHYPRGMGHQVGRAQEYRQAEMRAMDVRPRDLTEQPHAKQLLPVVCFAILILW